MADYFATRDSFWAVQLKGDPEIIGLLAVNGIESSGALDLGHIFVRSSRENDLDYEAIKGFVSQAFEAAGVQSIVCNNAEDWVDQIEPLKKLGMKIMGRSMASLREDDNGHPIQFTGCRMELSRQEWFEKEKPAASGGF
jgi:hypothetical protein